MQAGREARPAATERVCETCKHWSQAQSNSGKTTYGWGTCSAITVDFADGEQIPEDKAWMDAWGMHTEAVANLETCPDFGCNLWAAATEGEE